MTNRGFATRFTLSSSPRSRSRSCRCRRCGPTRPAHGARRRQRAGEEVREITDQVQGRRRRQVGPGTRSHSGACPGRTRERWGFITSTCRSSWTARSMWIARKSFCTSRRQRSGAPGWRGLPGARRRLGQDAPVCARTHGTEVPAVRGAEPVRAAAVLHAARVGLEAQPDGLVRELALEHLVRRVHRSHAVRAHASI